MGRDKKSLMPRPKLLANPTGFPIRPAEPKTCTSCVLDENILIAFSFDSYKKKKLHSQKVISYYKLNTIVNVAYNKASLKIK